MRKRILNLMICTVLIISCAIPATLATEVPTEQELAAASQQAQGLLAGDENGDLHLDAPLTRAQLACLLSPISLNPEHVAWEKDFYTKMCTVNFSDVPAWAQVHVGVCASNGLMSGCGNGLFAPDDPVTPQMACSVILRYLERDGWTWPSACDKALELDLIPAEAVAKDAITRGDMAILLNRALDFMAWLQTL